ncbi:cell division protein FtsL [Sulfuriflexus sp.]|uniref:cell division protein FtsL n=1 Tax=Sulfuriflexus sp. TaxID=2015443 RepID=UPI0028CE5F6F|nr:cell division protein FtsL [Sulfuriflexus sp.]MDT8403529.1 cell division protein FtsL [Sulfuriflexus sp.]
MQIPAGMTLLGVAVMVSALAVVYSRHESRKLFVELQALQEERDEMNVDWGRLQLEQSTWTTHGRVADTARERLDMVVPETAKIRILRY